MQFMLNQLIDINNPKILKVKDLKQHPKNPRKQNKEAMEFLEKSVEKLGSFRPLIINTKNEVLAGNQLLSILKKRKIEEIACLLPLKELTEEQEKAIIIADNQNSFYNASNTWEAEIVFNDFDTVLEAFNLKPVEFDLNMAEDLEEEKDESNIDDLETDCTIILKFDAITFESINKRLNTIKEQKKLETNEAVLLMLLQSYES